MLPLNVNQYIECKYPRAMLVLDWNESGTDSEWECCCTRSTELLFIVCAFNNSSIVSSHCHSLLPYSPYTDTDDVPHLQNSKLDSFSNIISLGINLKRSLRDDLFVEFTFKGLSLPLSLRIAIPPIDIDSLQLEVCLPFY